MQFELDEDRALLKSSTRELLQNESALADSRAIMEEAPEGYDKALYAQLGELGYPALLLDADAGGMGALAFAAVLSEMGRVAFPGPFLDLALAVRALADCGSSEAKSVSERAVAGEALVVLARGEGVDPGGAIQTRAVDGRVQGAKNFVPFGAQADALLVETRDGLALVERPGTGWNATLLTTFDHAQRFAAIQLDDPGVLVAEGDPARTVLEDVDRLGALGASALLLGLMEQALELTVNYTKEREAFGAPIASFQALQHRCADMLLQTESTRSAVFRAAWAEENSPDEAAYLSAVAKAWAGPAGRYVCGQAMQLHGGVGYTWEYDPHIYLKRTLTLAEFYGSTRDQLDAALNSRPS